MSQTPGQTVRVRLLFADQGTFHRETVQVPLDLLGRYDRLVDLLREEESVTRQLFVDMGRLVSAAVIGDED
jgi:hypothetical protein